MSATPSPTGDYDATVRAIRDLVVAAEAKARPHLHGRRRHPRRHLARNRPREERELDLAQRQTARPRFERRAEPRSPSRQRRQLLRALRGRRRCGQRQARRLRRHPRHRRRRRYRRRRPRARPARTPLPANGGTIPCPGPSPAKHPAPPAIAARRGCIETWLSGPALSRQFAHVDLTQTRCRAKS